MSDQLLPPNATPQEVALEAATARIENVPVPVRTMINPDTINSNLLPWLAWGMGVDFWDSGWDEDTKRRAIRTSIAVKKTEGTPYAVNTAIASVFVGSRMQEWHQQTPSAAPYTFRLLLTVTDQPLSAYTLGKCIDVALAIKNERSHLTEVEVSVQSPLTTYVAAACGIGTELRVGPRVRHYDGTWACDGTVPMNGIQNV